MYEAVLEHGVLQHYVAEIGVWGEVGRLFYTAKVVGHRAVIHDIGRHFLLLQ